MKIAILSDIHGNDTALKAVLMEIDKIGVDKILFLGDYVGYYCSPDIIFNLIKDYDKELIKGNHELLLEQALDNHERALAIQKKYGSGIEYAKKTLSAEQINYLIKLPEKKYLKIDGLKILMCHGSPWYVAEYIYPDALEARKQQCLETEADFVFIGHAHRSFIYEQGDKVLVNVGSVGQNRSGGGIASWGLLDTEKKICVIKESCYDIEPLIRQINEIDPDQKYLTNVLRRENKRANSMNELKTILITRCAGDISQSIAKILKMEYQDIKVIGCDTHDKHAGHFIFDNCFVVPDVQAKDYMKAVEKLVNQYKPDVIIPMSEAELRFYYKNKIFEIAGVHLIMPNSESFRVGDDKSLTQEFLKKNDLPHAWTIKVSDGRPQEFPCILKDVSGRGSKQIEIIQETDFDKYKDYGSQFIFQEYLLPDNEEYTCGLFRSKTGEIRTMIINRVLSYGYTGYGELVNNKLISDLLKLIAEKLDLVGSINVQLRLTDKKGPVVFEINPRFSSTVFFRHVLGFKDVIWTINDFFDKPLGEYNPVKPGAKIYKGWQEYILYVDGKKSTIDNAEFKMSVS